MPGTHTDLIPIQTIDKVPIAMIAATHDHVCPYHLAKWLRDNIATVKSFDTIMGEGHIYFSYAADETFMGYITSALENVDGIDPQDMEFLS